MNEYILIMLCSVFVASCSQVVLKKSSQKQYDSRLGYYLNPMTMGAYTVFLGCTLVSVYCLKFLPLITLGFVECSAYVYILVLDRIFFGRKITVRKLIGNVLIIVGISICLLMK